MHTVDQTTHYHRTRLQDLTGKRFGTLVALDRDLNASTRRGHWRCQCDCGAIKTVRAAYLTSGISSTCGDRAVHPAAPNGMGRPHYMTAHNRLRSQRGPASDHSCVDCGATAVHWSLDPQPGHVVYTVDGQYPFSDDVMAYRPRCAACHFYFDQQVTR